MAADPQVTVKALEIAWELTKAISSTVNVGGDKQTRQTTILDIFATAFNEVMGNIEQR